MNEEPGTPPIVAFWLEQRPGTTVEDAHITPTVAAEWLHSGQTVEGANYPEVVAYYAELMRQGQWRNLTIDAGGLYRPILFDGGGRVRIGLQRLEACVQAGVTFDAAVVRWPPQPADEYAAELARWKAQGADLDAAGALKLWTFGSMERWVHSMLAQAERDPLGFLWSPEVRRLNARR
jgi:hypothetical protein